MTYIRDRILNILIVLITQSYFYSAKVIILHSAHFFHENSK